MEPKSTPAPDADKPPPDLELVSRADEGAAWSPFGATVQQDARGRGTCLALPRRLFTYLDEHSVYTATGFVAYVRAFPGEMARALGVNREVVLSALPELIDVLAKVLPKEQLQPVPPNWYPYGTKD
ncbi:hypothetical protein R5W24_003902 [Gemmata sp. JC717]|uniref:hypothetical protein n=1 Tax=Gemmata algarum TaxID=2975278 RepID=UPI0021BAD901|nr:hypothetical protein [Gemmata algarum]MDY3554773.1 hypothetical protein [Gemmata algarum]